MLRKGGFLTVLLMLVLVTALLVLTACGEEEGKEARQIVEEAGDQAESFGKGFCNGAIVLAPLCLGVVAVLKRPPRR